MQKMKIFIKYNNNGFSLIEMMVVIVIISLLVLGLVTFFSGGIRSWIAGNNQLKAQSEARQAIDYMVKEIRIGDKVEVGSSGTAIKLHVPKFDTSSSSAYSVEYGRYGYQIKRVQNGTENVIIENVYNLLFTYFDVNGTEIFSVTSPENEKISRIHIKMEIDVDGDAYTGGNADIVINTKVDLRNYGYLDDGG